MINYISKNKTLITYLLIFLSAFLLNFILNEKINWESNFNKHYFENGKSYYGAFNSHYYLRNNNNFIEMHAEPWQNILNMYSMSGEKSDLHGGHQVDRIFFSSYFPSLINRALGDKIDLFNTYLITNLILHLISSLSIFFIVRKLFISNNLALLASIFFIIYPAFNMNYLSMKIPLQATTFFLIFFLLNLYDSKKILFKNFQLLSILFILSFYSAGAWLYIFIFSIIFNLSDIKKLKIIIFSFIVGALSYYILNKIFELGSPYSSLYNYRESFFKATINWIIYFFTFKDVNELFFLNYQGFTFFTKIIPQYVVGFFKTGPLIILVSLAYLIIKRERKIFFIILLFYPLSHAPMIIAGGWDQYYGYTTSIIFSVLIIYFPKACYEFFYDNFFNRNLGIFIISSIFLLQSIYLLYPKRMHIENFFYNNNHLEINKDVYIYNDGNLDKLFKSKIF